MSDLKIQITGSLNTKATATEINGQLQQLEKDIGKVNLSNVSFDFSELTKGINEIKKALKEFTIVINKQTESAKDFNKVIKENKTVVKELDGTVKEITQQHLKNGEIIVKETEKINKQTKALKDQATEAGRLASELDDLGKKQKSITKLDGKGNLKSASTTYGDAFNSTTVNENKNGNVTSETVTENIRKQEQAVERLTQKLEKLNNTGVITNSSFTRMSSALELAGTEAELHKIEQIMNRISDSSKEREKTKELEHQLELYKRQAQVKYNKITNSNKVLDVDQKGQLNSWLNDVKNLNMNTPQLQQKMKNLSMTYGEIDSMAQKATKSTHTFGSMLSQAFEKFPIWINLCSE